MNLNEIEIEEKKWKDENFQKSVQDRLCQYVGNLDEILQKKYALLGSIFIDYSVKEKGENDNE